jgi:hypothetical protein
MPHKVSRPHPNRSNSSGQAVVAMNEGNQPRTLTDSAEILLLIAVGRLLVGDG